MGESSAGRIFFEAKAANQTPSDFNFALQIILLAVVIEGRRFFGYQNLFLLPLPEEFSSPGIFILLDVVSHLVLSQHNSNNIVGRGEVVLILGRERDLIVGRSNDRG
jgi:hypothetical protein